MKFSESWLRSLVDPKLTSEELSHLLTMAGLEVEELQPVAPAFTSVVVAQVLEVVKHPDADRLNVCQVDIGSGTPQQIVCGAPNVAAGLKVPCALPGAELPGDFRIKVAKVRGIESSGMLCSAKELGIAEEASGLLILPVDAPVGQSIRQYLDLDDQQFELKLTPNRADCLSLLGIAREVGAITGAATCLPVVQEVPASIADQRSVVLDAPDACPLYCGRVIKDVNAKAPTPEWMKRRLERSGLRSISAIVDITNYILLEQGQPMHAFDLDKIDGGITVRMARDGEKLVCLNEKEIELTPDLMVIADAAKPLAIAGIMGGLDSGVTTASRDIFLESAFFQPEAIAGKARALGFGSDSSYRYERGVDFALQTEAIERATALVLEICGGEPGPLTETVSALPARASVAVRTARVARVLGVTLAADEIAAIFTRLGLPFEQNADGFVVSAPSFRFDIAIEEDLIEEIARVYGYDNIPADAPVAAQTMLPQPEGLRVRSEVRRLLAGRDFQEIVSYAFVEEKWERDFAGNANPVRLINPIASQMSVMRSSLIGGLVDVLVGNLNRKHNRVRVFEIARVFQKQADGSLQQPERVAGLAYGSRVAEQWASKAERVDFYDAKADVEALLHPRVAEYRKGEHPAFHPGRCAEVVLDGAVVGHVGELHPRWVQAYGLSTAPVLFELAVEAAEQVGRVKLVPVSKFQPVRRDLALVVAEEVTAATLQQAMLAVAPEFVRELALFDLYRGKGVDEGKKSLAFRIVLQAADRTLVDDEVEQAVAAMLAAAEAAGAVLRA